MLIVREKFGKRRKILTSKKKKKKKKKKKNRDCIREVWEEEEDYDI